MRLAADEHADVHEVDDVKPPSHLPLGLLLEYCDGVLSATRLCKHVRNSVAGGSTDKLDVRISKGVTEFSKNNANRCVNALLAEVKLLDTISPVEESTTWSHVIIPSDLFRMYSKVYPDKFVRGFGADEHTLKSFWDEFFNSPVRRAWAHESTHMRHKHASDMYRHIPMAVHEDAGPVTKRKSANCISTSPLLGKGGEKLTRM